MIFSASRRTDIPRYYSDWLLHRLQAGTVLLQNPMNKTQINRLTFSPETVDCIVFWTKDAGPMLERLDELERLGYRSYLQFTLTPYGKELEKNLRDKKDITHTLLAVSKRLGAHRIHWRYDPIILNDTLIARWHEEQFTQLCQLLSPYVDGVTISFVDIYAKLRTDLVRPIHPDEMLRLGAALGRIARQFGLSMFSCCEQVDMTSCDIQKGCCIDKTALEKVCGYPLFLKRDKNQRPGCGCYESVDIGAYNTCLSGCVYCYANHGPESILRNTQSHNPHGELLTGNPPATVREKQAWSCHELQERLF